MVNYDDAQTESNVESSVYEMYEILENAGERIEEVLNQCEEKRVQERMLGRIQVLCDDFLQEIEHEKEVLEIVEMGVLSDNNCV